MQTKSHRFLVLTALAIAVPAASGGEGADAELRLEVRPAIASSPRALAGPPPDLQALFERGADPRSLAAGDFDEDGVTDLAAGYAAGGSGLGLVAVWRGNVDSLDPWGAEARRRRAGGTFTDAPFLGPPTVAALAEPADYLAAGDFDGDGYRDLAAARAGGVAIYLLAGRTRGEFAAAEAIALPGRITAWAAGEINRRDGLEDLAVAVDGEAGPMLLVFEGPNGALRRAPEAVPLPAPAAALAIGYLDGDFMADVAVAAGYELSIVHGRDRRLSVSAAARKSVRPPRVRGQRLPFAVRALAAGDFLPGRRYPQQLAVLSRRGDVHLLSRPGDDGEEPWRVDGPVAAGLSPGSVSGGGSPPLVPARISGSGRSDLVTFDARTGEVLLFDGGLMAAAADPAARPVAESPITGLSASDRFVAALPLRLDPNASSDLVMLSEGDPEPRVIGRASCATTWTVNATDDTNDSFCNGTHCSLREAINAATSGDCIHFQLDGLLPTIVPENPLPTIGSNRTIDGTTQPVSGAVAVSGASVLVGGNGFTVTGTGTVIRGLHIHSFDGHGVELTGGSNIVERCRIGLTSVGVEAGNSLDGVHSTADANTIGCTETHPNPCNVISDNQWGVRILGSSIDLVADNLVQGNYIGTDVSGSSAIQNSQDGVRLANASLTSVGGLTTGSGNLVSGHVAKRGIDVGEGVESTTVQGNRVGTNAAGSAALPNRWGVFVDEDTDATTVGCTSLTPCNVISGNNDYGIRLSGANALVQGNFIGTDADGTAALGNEDTGVRHRGTSTNSTIGGDMAGAGNVISGNGGAGLPGEGINVNDENNITGLAILGNFIGTDKTGSVSISVMLGPGVLIRGFGSSTILVGDGTAAGANRIAFNQCGVLVDDGSGRSVRRNEIFSNQRLGISLHEDPNSSDNCGGEDFVTLNDLLDTDAGANGLKNFPVIESVTTVAATTTVAGSHHGSPLNTSVIDLYSSAACDENGFGEGEEYLGSAVTVADLGGNAAFSVDLAAIPVGRYVTATATGDSQPDTSEFSACRREHPTCGGPAEVVLKRSAVTTQQTFEACQTIEVAGRTGDIVSVELTGHLILRAGQWISLGNGFSVSGTLEAEIDPDLALP